MPPPQSKVWTHFQKKDRTIAKCKECFRDVKYSGNTSNLYKHLKNNHPKVLQSLFSLSSADGPPSISEKRKKSAGSDSDPRPSTSSAEQHDMDEDDHEPEIKKKEERPIVKAFNRSSSYAEGGIKHGRLINCLLYFICKDNRPFAVVSGEGFQCLMNELSPSFKVPSTGYLKRQLSLKYETLAKRFKDRVGAAQHVSLTMDVWTETMAERSFLGVTVHFLEGTSLISLDLTVKCLTSRHTAENLKDEIVDILQLWGIEMSKIVSIITDNGANIVAAVNLLNSNIQIPCLAHTLNLVLESIETLQPVQALISKVRDIVKYIKNSTIQSDKLRALQAVPEGCMRKLKLDCKTRWNSTYYMLETFLELAKFVSSILMDSAGGPEMPTSAELGNLRQIIGILKPFEFITKEFSGEKYVTILKIVADTGDENESTVRGLLRNTLINAQDIVSASSRRNSNSPLTDQPVPVPPPIQKPAEKPSSVKEPGRRADSCRVCLRSFKPDDYIRICSSCKMKVCDDCASYSQLGEGEDESMWSCSVCRRKQQNAARLIMAAQDSQDSLLDVPLVDTLQRRHSDIKISSSSSSTKITSLGTGLAPPRSPELRRHSDVSPASLKEIEKALLKVASEKREEMRWERELEWRQKQTNSGGNEKTSKSNPGSKSSLNTIVAKPDSLMDRPQDSSSRKDDNLEEMISKRQQPKLSASPTSSQYRRKSQLPLVPKQHSCDDDLKNEFNKNKSNLLQGSAISRRASAYDVYQNKTDGGFSGANKTELSERRSSYRLATPPEVEESRAEARRRSSYRGHTSSKETDEFSNLRRSPSRRKSSMENEPSSGLAAEVTSPEYVDEERRARRRGSQLPDIYAIKAGILPSHGISPRSSLSTGSSSEIHSPELLRRQSSLSGEDIKIVIDDVDKLDLSESGNSNVGLSPMRKVVLKRDPNERIHKTRGFGMRVIGGKPGADGSLYTYIVWTMPGGPAERANLRKGDKILELCGIPLVNLCFEEVSAIMDRSGDIIDMIVETQGAASKLNEFKDDTMRRRTPEIVEPQDLSVSPTRRKLPKTPLEMKESSFEEQHANIAHHNQQQLQIQQNKQDTQASRLQLQLWCREKKTILEVSIFAADNLPLREDYHFGGLLPEAYVRTRLLPTRHKGRAVYSDVAEPNQHPIWNTTLEIRAENGENVLEKVIEITVWDQRPDGEQIFIGEVIITDMDMAIDQPVWYRIEHDSKRFPESPTPSVEGLSSQRSLSEERDIEIEGAEANYGFLHPDHAYLAGSRRGSSQSEQLEVEPYQLNRDFSRSLPGSRRSSFQSGQNIDKDIPPITYPSKGRRRSSCTPRPNPDEILKNLKAVKGELLGRSMSICAGSWNMRRRSSDRRKESKESVLEVAEPTGEDKQDDTMDEEFRDDRKLGPFQLEPRYTTFNKAINIELNLGLSITKGQLAVEVVSARGIAPTEPPPDTYVKTYLRDNDRLLNKRKTRVVTRSCTPEFNQTIKYPIKDLADRSLLVMLWERQKGFEHNHGLGSAEIRMDTLKLSDNITGWYPLFPVQKIGSESNDSP